MYGFAFNHANDSDWKQYLKCEYEVWYGKKKKKNNNIDQCSIICYLDATDQY